MQEASKSSDDLLFTLVELKKEEMRRTRNSRTVTFLMITLPTFLLIAASVYGAFKFAQSGADILQSIPELISDGVTQEIENLVPR